MPHHLPDSRRGLGGDGEGMHALSLCDELEVASVSHSPSVPPPWLCYGTHRRSHACPNRPE